MRWYLFFVAWAVFWYIVGLLIKRSDDKELQEYYEGIYDPDWAEHRIEP